MVSTLHPLPSPFLPPSGHTRKAPFSQGLLQGQQPEESPGGKDGLVIRGDALSVVPPLPASPAHLN